VSSVRLGGKEVSRALAWPQRLPGGKSVLVSDWDASRFGAVAVLDLETRGLTHLQLDVLFARYIRSGHILFLKPDGTLMVAPFDPVGGKLTGQAIAVAREVSIGNNWGGAFAASDSGTYVSASGYLRGSGREPMKLVRAAAGGKILDLPTDAIPWGRYPRVSPDGRRLVVSDWDGNLWIVDALRGSRVRLPMGGVIGQDFQAWSPDGRWIAFPGGEEGKPSWGIYRQRADGSAAPEVLLEGDGLEKHPYSFTPDGRELLFAQRDDLMLLPMESKAAPRSILRGDHDMPALSPNGQWLAYEGNAGAGTTEVFVQPYPPKGGRVQVSSGGGLRPVWTRNGNRIFFRTTTQVLSVTMGGTPEAPEPSPPALFAELPGMRGFDVAADGREVIAIVRPAGTGIVRQLSIATNWFDQLKRVVPAGTSK
jgi:hypothetical protein